MLPVLFKLGPFVLYSYGVVMLVGFLLALFVVWKKAREEHFEESDILDVVLISGFWGMVSSRIFYVIVHFDQFGVNVIDWLNIFGRPGFVFVGGLLGGGLTLWKQTTLRKWDFYEFSDFVVMGLSLLMVFGWLGSFLNGSSFGLPTESPLGVRFVGMFDKRHPVQLYALFGHLLLFSYLIWVEGKYRTFEWYRAGKSGVRSGFLVFNFVVFLGLIQVMVSGLSSAVFQWQSFRLDIWIWLLFVLIGLWGIYWRSGREWTKDVKVFSGGKRRQRVERRRAKRRKETITSENDIL